MAWGLVVITVILPLLLIMKVAYPYKRKKQKKQQLGKVMPLRRRDEKRK